jgi:DNA excision repair protein ERCC-3
MPSIENHSRSPSRTRANVGLTAAASRREAIVETLADCPVHRWVAADELLRLVRASRRDFAVSRNPWHLYKQALVGAGYPAEDLAGYVAGEPLDVALRAKAVSGSPSRVRDYQRHGAEPFYLAGSERGGSGIVVLPCGAGKTIVGLAAMALVKQTTLVLTTSLTAVKQWRRELLDKTTLRPEDIAEYTGEQKSTGPVTLTTYQILTWRADRDREFPHLELFRARAWGLIVYDEVHLLPAPVFRATADLQARRRLGLTAPSCARMAARVTSSRSSAPNGSTCPGGISSERPGSRPPPASRSASP